MAIKFGCFNCRGIYSDVVKRNDIFNWLKEKKLDICVLLETHSTSAVQDRWRAEWDGPAWFSSYKSNSRGVAVLFKNTFSFSVHKVILDDEGRSVVLDMSIQEKRFSLVGLYGPNQDDPRFFDDIKQKLIDIGNQDMIMTGDWNVVLDYKMDCLNYTHKNNQKANEAIHELMTFFDLEDVWRSQHPKKRVYSWFGPNRRMGRLDYFLLSTDLAQSVNCMGYNTGYRSDHSLCHVSLPFTQQQRGRGTWKFNNSLLHDHEYVNMVKLTINNLVTQYRTQNQGDLSDPALVEFSINDQLFFEMLKLTIRGNTIPYSSRKKKEREQNEQQLFKELEEISNKLIDNQGDNLYEVKARIERELEQIREEKTRGQLVRAKAKWIKDGEKCTKLFCNLEKRNFIDKSMQKVVLPDGSVLTEGKEILNAQKEFYESLYSSKGSKLNEEAEKSFFDNNNPFINKLSDEEAALCEGKLTLDECLRSLKNMQNDKSPGSDGFSSEFYKFFWRDLGTFLLRSLNYSFETGQLSVTQRHGTITCLPKTGKPKEQLKSWRPITLLNVDLKIASGAIAIRMKNHLSNIISESQKGYIKGRYIGECTRLIYDILYETKIKKMPGLLLLVDFQKAFDSLEMPFLQRALRYFGFKSDFCKWVELFYTDITSSVTNNGYMSEQFNLSRGVRQGDPLSPYLFILAVECLSAAIKFHPGINGIKIKNSEYLITQLADDTTLLLDGSEASLKNCLEVFSNFQKCSGLQINVEKTQAIWIGCKVGSKEKLLKERKLDWNIGGIFKLLGITYDLSDPLFTTQNYELCLESIRTLLNNWRWRPLTILGKITVVKSLALSKLVHLFMAIPNPPTNYLKRLESVIYKFIWKGVDKVKRSVMIGKIEQGGLNMIHLESFSNSLKIIWIKKLLDNLNISSWKTLFLSTVELEGGNHIWYGNLHTKRILERVNPFWQNVLKMWANVPRKEAITANEIQMESLWYNRHIQIQNSPLFYPQWFRKNVKYINDLVDETGNFLSFIQFQQKFNLTVSFIEYYGLISLIPAVWKSIISKQRSNLHYPIENILIKRIKADKKPSKLFYSLIVTAFVESPVASQNKWKEEIQEINIENWPFWYTLPKATTLDTKMQFFQYKILHRILVTNSKLLLYGINENDRCTFCDRFKESIIHLLWECVYTKGFITKVREWLGNLNAVNVLDRTIFIFGVKEGESSVNTVLIWTKYFIYWCRCKGVKPDFHHYKMFIKKNILIEKHSLNNENAWNQKWHKYLT